MSTPISGQECQKGLVGESRCKKGGTRRPRAQGPLEGSKVGGERRNSTLSERTENTGNSFRVRQGSGKGTFHELDELKTVY